MNKYLMRRLGVSDDPTGLRPTLQDCIEAVLAQSDVLIEDVLKGLEGVVGQAKPKVAQLHYRAISKPAVAQLRREFDAVRATFGVQLRLAIYHSGAQDSARASAVRFDDLQLLDAQQIDANIEFALAQQEVQFAVDEQLPALNALVSRLLGWLTVQPHLNPLKPEAFARALRETLLQHVPDEQARSGLITPAAGFLGASLRHLYKELMNWLRSHGVEPVVAAQAASRRKTAENPVSRTMLTLGKLRRLLSGELDSSTEREAVDSRVLEFLHTVPASLEALEELKMVEPLMKRLSQRAAQATPATPDGKKTGKGQGHQLGRQLGEEVVRLMLDNLMQDERLLPAIRQQVKGLEPVLLKLARSDPRFFSDRKHPARQLLDKLTHRSLAYQAEREEGFGAFLQSVAAAVHELAVSQGEAEDFAHALQTLQAQWADAGAGHRQRQAEAARALLHAEQRNLLAQRLAADFEVLLQKQKVPERVALFLCGPWAQVVAEAQLASVDDTAVAEGYLALVDDLVWSVQVPRARRNRVRLAQLVPTLLVKLRQGLQSIHYPQERIALFLAELIALHEQALASSPTKAAADVPVDLPLELAGVQPVAQPHQQLVVADDAADGGTDERCLSELAADEAVTEGFWVAEDEAREAGYLPEGAVVPPSPAGVLAHDWSVADLSIGTWVELMLKQEWVRAQLTWTSPQRTLFMFTSAKGLAHSMTRRTMDRLRNRGLIRVVSDGHVVDSALDAVAQAALRNEQAQAADDA
ncbi:MAG: hypothetical protein A2Z93_00800 [Curvibacter sp. GWA2_64_110]|nr:MAG: hypothetical protein A2Z93_00800 [Curvibacter sp. GWA2_64_110]HCY17037.1 hypothetical protein [Curvibacter sp.]